MSTIGYIRVSSAGQNTDRQLADIDCDKLFTDKASGKNTDNRPELQAMFDWIREGDCVKVHSIDRLARSLVDLKQIIEQIVAKGATVQFVTGPLQDPIGDKTDASSNLMLNMFGAFAEFERSMIRERQAEGIAAAKARGKHLGRPGIDASVKRSVRNRKKSGATIRAIMDEFNLSRSSVYRCLKAAA